MALSDKEVAAIAELARLTLSDEEKQKFGKDLSKILEYVETLKGAALSVDPDGVLHVALPSSDATGVALLSNRDRLERDGIGLENMVARVFRLVVKQAESGGRLIEDRRVAGGVH